MPEIFEGPEFEAKRKQWIKNEVILHDGEISARQEYEYDTEGRKILERRSIGPNEKPEGFQETKFEYNEFGRLIKKTTRQDEEQGGFDLVDETTYRYDDDNKLIEQNERSTNVIGLHDIHDPEARYFHYDDKNRLIREVRLRTDQVFFETHLSEESKYEYAQDGSYIKTSADPLGKSVTKYNAEGHKVLYENYDRDGKVKYQTNYTYENGLPVKAEVVHPETGEIMNEKAYSYDERGNLTRVETKYRDGKTSVEERRLEYFG